MEIRLQQKHPCPVAADAWPIAKRGQYHDRDIATLAPELAVKILSYLEVRDLLVCQRVTSAWQGLVNIVLDTSPKLPRAFYRCCHPMVPVPRPSKIADGRHATTRNWLRDFSEKGHDAAMQLDKLLESGDRYGSERLFFSVARTLAQTARFDLEQACTLQTKMLKGVCFSPDERYLVLLSHSSSRTITIYQRVGRRWQPITPLDNSATKNVYSAGFSPDGDLFVTVCGDCTAHIWKPTGKWWPRQTILRTWYEFPPCFSHDGRFLVTVRDSKTWQINHRVNGQWHGQTTLRSDHLIASLCIHPNKYIIATISHRGHVQIWQLIDETWKFQVSPNDPPTTTYAEFSADGNRLLLNNCNSECSVIWNGAHGTWTKEDSLIQPDMLDNVWFTANGHLATIFSKGTMKRERHRPYEKAVKIWRFCDNNWREVMLPGAKDFCNACFSPCGHNLATASRDGMVKLWRDIDGQWQDPLTLLRDHTSGLFPTGVKDLCFSVHGHHLLIVREDQTASIWGFYAGTWQEKATLPAPYTIVTARFSPSACHILTTRKPATTDIWTLSAEVAEDVN